MILSANLSYDESAANDRENEYSRAEMKQLIVKRRVELQLHFLAIPRIISIRLYTLFLYKHTKIRIDVGDNDTEMLRRRLLLFDYYPLLYDSSRD